MIGNFFIQPFDIDYKKYSGYIYTQVEGHRVYKEFYVIIDRHYDGKTVIMVVAVHHDGKVYKYINDEDYYSVVKEKMPGSRIFYSSIKLLTNESGNNSYAKVFFRTERSEMVEIELYCPKKLYRKKNAITRRETVFTDQNSKSTIFYTGKIMYASKKSNVSITGKEYDIKKKKQLPFITRNLDMYYIKDLGIINIFNENVNARVKYMPDELVQGEKFIYELENGTVQYDIEKISDGNVYISSKRNKIVAKKTPDGLALFKVFVTMHAEAPELVFYPPINFTSERNNSMMVHKFSLTMGKSSVMGEAIYYGKGNKGFEIALVSGSLGWSVENPFMACVCYDEDGIIHYKNGIMLNQNLDLSNAEPDCSN